MQSFECAKLSNVIYFYSAVETVARQDEDMCLPSIFRSEWIKEGMWKGPCPVSHFQWDFAFLTLYLSSFISIFYYRVDFSLYSDPGCFHSCLDFSDFVLTAMLTVLQGTPPLPLPLHSYHILPDQLFSMNRISEYSFKNEGEGKRVRKSK